SRRDQDQLEVAGFSSRHYLGRVHAPPGRRGPKTPPSFNSLLHLRHCQRRLSLLPRVGEASPPKVDIGAHYCPVWATGFLGRCVASRAGYGRSRTPEWGQNEFLSRAAAATRML